MKATIIGTNRLAASLAMALEKGGIKVGEIYAGDIRDALALSERLYAALAVNSLNFLKSESDLFIICVADEDLKGIVEEISLPKGSVLLHTSGTKPLSILNENDSLSGLKKGVIFPLFPFNSREVSDFKQIPLLIESAAEEDFEIIRSTARTLSKTVVKVNSRQRQTFSSAIVFAVDFTTHLWALSKEIMESESLDFNLIKPLIKNTVEDILDAEHPADCQSGPALNDDAETINSHITLLSDDPELVEVYTLLTESILHWHGSE